MSDQLPGNARRRAPKGRQPARRPPVLEQLETRDLLSAASVVMVPLAKIVTGPSPPGPPAPPFTGYTPAQVRQAYSFTGVGTGAGQTIAIVDAYNDPTIAADLTAFDNNYGLSAASLTVVNQTGGSTLPTVSDTAWSTEAALDVEWAHAIAPGAKILLVEANTGSQSDLLAAVQTAAGYSGVSVVSMSWGASEFSGETADDSYFTTPSGHGNVTFIAATGDSGAGAIWPASSPNVVAVGGTTLTVGTGGAYAAESAWIDGGGGASKYEASTSAQETVTGSFVRDTPDVSYDADPSTGFAVYSAGSWMVEGGTSAGAPQWAAIIAIADQSSGSALSTSQTISALYSAPAADFHDVTTGSNGYPATAGYDLATGIGTPIANKLIPNLVAPAGGTGGGGGSGSGGSSGGTGGGHQTLPPPTGSTSPDAVGRDLFGGPALQIVVTGGTAAAVGLGQSVFVQTPAAASAADQAFSLLSSGNLSLQAASTSGVRPTTTPASVANPAAPSGSTSAETSATTALSAFDGLHYAVARRGDADPTGDLLAGDVVPADGVPTEAWTDAPAQDGNGDPG
jgi:hypothetical protein